MRERQTGNASVLYHDIITIKSITAVATTLCQTTASSQNDKMLNRYKAHYYSNQSYT